MKAKKKSGVLTLVPTPIDNENPLEGVALAKLRGAFEQGHIIAVEEAKACRRRWISWGLPREAIESFVLYNEHTRGEEAPHLLKELQNGKNVYLLSDCGLPAFCDPGRMLVEMCHQSDVTVTATPFSSSIPLAVALSGFPHERFIFEGFVPRRNPERAQALKRILAQPEVSVVMDTPYRLEKLLDEMNQINGEREVFLGMDLNKKDEAAQRAKIKNIKVPVSKSGKKEFVMVVGPKAE